jgi:hypothetical protein
VFEKLFKKHSWCLLRKKNIVIKVFNGQQWVQKIIKYYNNRHYKRKYRCKGLKTFLLTPTYSIKLIIKELSDGKISDDGKR